MFVDFLFVCGILGLRLWAPTNTRDENNLIANAIAHLAIMNDKLHEVRCVGLEQGVMRWHSRAVTCPLPLCILSAAGYQTYDSRMKGGLPSWKRCAESKKVACQLLGMSGV